VRFNSFLGRELVAIGAADAVKGSPRQTLSERDVSDDARSVQAEVRLMGQTFRALPLLRALSAISHGTNQLARCRSA
jgi:hypothetical protein